MQRIATIAPVGQTCPVVWLTGGGGTGGRAPGVHPLFLGRGKRVFHGRAKGVVGHFWVCQFSLAFWPSQKFCEPSPTLFCLNQLD